MSEGWIKFEKDLRTDPRVLKIAKRLCNASPLQGVTLALGGLAQLWMLADTHVGNDDIFALGIDQINEVIGIEGFCQLIPQDWLQVIDSEHVKFPDYHVHNGTIAKARAQTNARVSKHRKLSNGQALQGCNSKVLPDQDQDQDLKKKIDKRKSATRLPDDWYPIEADHDYALKLKLDPAQTAAGFRDHWHAAATASARKLDWSAAWRTWCRNELKFARPGFGTRGLPAKPDDTAAFAEAAQRAAALGFRGPWPQESLGAYVTQIKLFETQNAPSALKAIQARLGVMRSAAR